MGHWMGRQCIDLCTLWECTVIIHSLHHEYSRWFQQWVRPLPAMDGGSDLFRYILHDF